MDTRKSLTTSLSVPTFQLGIDDEANPDEKFMIHNNRMHCSHSMQSFQPRKSALTADYHRTFLMMQRSKMRPSEEEMIGSDSSSMEDEDADEHDENTVPVAPSSLPSEPAGFSDDSSTCSEVSDYDVLYRVSNTAESNNPQENTPLKTTQSEFHALLKVNVTEQKLTKYLEIGVTEPVWVAKQRIMKALTTRLPNILNYGFYCKKRGIFLLEHKPLSEYVEAKSVGTFEFRYKRRIYNLPIRSAKDSKCLLKMQGSSKRKELMRYVSQRNVEKINYLIKKGVDPNFQIFPDGETPLTTAVALSPSARVGSISSSPVIMALLNGSAHMDFRNRQGYTPLHVAVRTGNVNIVKTLIDNGAPPNAVDNNDLTPLYHCALLDVAVDCIKPLKRAGADLSCVNAQKWTLLHQICRYGRFAHLQVILNILSPSEDHCHLLNAQNESGNTALHLCAIYNHPLCLLSMLKHGVDRSVNNFSQQDAFQVAVVAQNMNLAKLIKDHHALDDQEISLLMLESACDDVNKSSSEDQKTLRRHTVTAASLNKISGYLSQTLQRRNPFAKEKSSKYNKHMPLNVTLPRNAAIHRPVSSMPEMLLLSHDQPLDGKYKSSRMSSTKENVMYIASKDYTACNSNEVNLRKGDVFTGTSTDDCGQDIPEGFCRGTANGKTGFVPLNCVQTVQLRKPLGEPNSPKSTACDTKKDKDEYIVIGSRTDNMLNEPNDVPLQSTSHPDIFHRFHDVLLSKGPEGYGFVLRGAKSDGPIENFSTTARHPGLQYLESVEVGSNAYRAGLRAGDFVLKINTTDVTCMGHKQTVDVIRRIRDPIRLSVVSVIFKTKERHHEDGSARTSETSLNDVKATSPQAKIARSGSIRSAIGQLDSVLEMEEVSDQATASLRRRPVSRMLRNRNMQEIFDRHDVDGQKGGHQCSGEPQSLSSSTSSHRLTQVLPPTVPPSASEAADNISQNGSTYSSNSLGRSSSFSSQTSPTAHAMPGLPQSLPVTHGDGNFQTGVPHVTNAPASTKKPPPPPPQRRSSRLTSTSMQVEDGRSRAATYTPPPVAPAISPVSPTATQSVGRSFVANQAKGDLSGFAAAVANQAQQRRERLSSSDKPEKVTSVPITHNLMSKPPPAVAPKPGRVKSDAAMQRTASDGQSAFALAMAAKQASLRHRSQTEPLLPLNSNLLKPASSFAQSSIHKPIAEEHKPSPEELREIMQLPPPPPPPTEQFNLPPPPPKTPKNSYNHIVNFDPAILPPPPDTLLIPPPNSFAAESKAANTKNASSAAAQKNVATSDRLPTVLSNGVDSTSNPDSGVDDVGPNNRHHHNETKSNSETLSVVSSVSTLSSEEGSDAGLSMSYDPKTTPDQTTGNMYLDALKKNKSSNVTPTDTRSIVLTKVSFTASKAGMAGPEPVKSQPTKPTPKVIAQPPAPSSPVEAKPLADWTVDDVTAWLSGLGLDMYTQVFAENEIIGSHLPDLGKDDLQELGVTRVGHRLTIERSLKKLMGK